MNVEKSDKRHCWCRKYMFSEWPCSVVADLELRDTHALWASSHENMNPSALHRVLLRSQQGGYGVDLFFQGEVMCLGR